MMILKLARAVVLFAFAALSLYAADQYGGGGGRQMARGRVRMCLAHHHRGRKREARPFPRDLQRTEKENRCLVRSSKLHTRTRGHSMKS